MFDVGGGELILILLVVLLLFGPNKLPELARSVGKGLRSVRKAQEDLTQQIRDISAEVAEPIKDTTVQVKTDVEAIGRTMEQPNNRIAEQPNTEPPATSNDDLQH